MQHKQTLHKPASQISTCSTAVASLGNDGITTGTNHFHTHDTGAGNWWQVELSATSATCNVQEVVFWNRHDCCRTSVVGAKIQLWDGNPLTTDSSVIATSPALTSACEQHLAFAATGVRHVRLCGPTTGCTCAAEIQVLVNVIPPDQLQQVEISTSNCSRVPAVTSMVIVICSCLTVQLRPMVQACQSKCAAAPAERSSPTFLPLPFR